LVKVNNQGKFKLGEIGEKFRNLLKALSFLTFPNNAKKGRQEERN